MKYIMPFYCVNCLSFINIYEKIILLHNLDNYCALLVNFIGMFIRSSDFCLVVYKMQ